MKIIDTIKWSLLISFAIFILSIFTNQSMADTDSTAPQITAFSITPTAFNTESEDQTLTLNMTLTEDRAGVDANGVGVRIKPLTGTQSRSFNNITLISGNDRNGTYAATVVVPKGSAIGTWKVEYVLLTDKLGNYVYISPEQLIGMVPGATGLTLTNTASSGDSTAPQITAFSITPTAFNTESEDQTLTLNMTLTEDRAGVDANSVGVRIKPLVGIQLQDFNNITLISGNDRNGTYAATVVVPKGSAIGTWKVEYVLLTDKLGNYVYISPEQLIGMVPGATGLTLTNTASSGDSTAPQITAFSITPTSPNTEFEDQTLMLNMTLTDNMAGVNINGVNVIIRPLVSTQLRNFNNVTLTSGDDKNGTYTATVVMPRGSAIGTWKVEYVLLTDKLGNYSFVSSDQLIQRVPSATGVTITNLATVGDLAVPQITAFSINPTSFSSDLEDQNLTLNMTLTDDMVGVDATGLNVRIAPYAEGVFDDSQIKEFNDVALTSGDDKNGTYAATLVIPKGSATGTWKVEDIFLIDKLGNYSYVTPEQLVAMVPGAIGVTLTNDATIPQITAFSITPIAFSVNQTLTLNMTLTDDTGVNFSGLSVRIAPYAGDIFDDSQLVDFNNVTLTSGDDKNGTYTATVVMPRGSAIGTWKVEYVLLTDKLGNYSYVSPEQLIEMVPGAIGVTLTSSDNTSPAAPSNLFVN